MTVEFRSHQIDISEELAGLRLDQALARLFPQYSRQRLQGWIEAGAVTLNGSLPRSKDKVLGGEQVHIQARIEAESIKAIDEKYQQNSDPEFRTRALIIKEQRSELVKHHLWVLWTDYFKPPHFEKYPQLHTLFNEATKLAGASGTKGSADPATADQLLAKIEEISKIFWETKQG